MSAINNRKIYTGKFKSFHIRFNYFERSDEDSKGFHTLYPRLHTKYLLPILAKATNVREAHYQREKGTTGNFVEHWQLTVLLDKPWNKYQMISVFKLPKSEKWYCEGCVNEDASKVYTTKPGTRVEGPFQYTRPCILNALKRI